MGILNPPVGESKPFTDVLKEGDVFTLLGARVVKATSADYGEGEMVILSVRHEGKDHELSLWGRYLVEQAKAAEEGDYGKRYKIARRVVEGYSQRPVKCLTPETVEDHPL